MSATTQRVRQATRRLVALVALVFFSSCTASVGPLAVHSSGLGLESPYGALYADLRGERIEGEVRVGAARKTDSDSGYGATGRALVRVGRSAWTLGAGSYFTYQTHDLWDKATGGPVLVGRWTLRRGEAELALYGPDGDKVTGSAMLRVRGVSRLAPLVEFERVRHTEGSGSRVAVGVVWRVN